MHASTRADRERENAEKRILIVEDDPTIRKMEEKILGAAGYQIDIAGDGESGLEKIRRAKYDLVIIDVTMPGMNGFELAKILQGDPELGRVKVLFVTAKNTAEDLKTGFARGALLYLIKPFTSAMLLTTVKTAIG